MRRRAATVKPPLQIRHAATCHARYSEFCACVFNMLKAYLFQKQGAKHMTTSEKIWLGVAIALIIISTAMFFI
jgi:hypothetical protein